MSKHSSKSKKKLRLKKPKAPRLTGSDENVPTPAPTASTLFMEEVDRARRARHKRHRDQVKKSQQHQDVYDKYEDLQVDPEINARTTRGGVSTTMLTAILTRDAANNISNSSVFLDEALSRKQGFKEWVPFFSIPSGYGALFRFASVLDYTLMTIGTLAALVAGCCIPGLIYLLGNLIRVKVLVDKMNCSSETSSCEPFLATCEEKLKDHSNYQDRVFLKRPLPLDNIRITEEHLEYYTDFHFVITFTYTISSSIYSFCWNYASENQGGKLRRAYFQSLLHKDLSWFETQEDPEAVNRALENTRFMVEVIGDSLPTALSLLVMSILCLTLALFHGWQLTMVCLTTIPFMLGTLYMVNAMKAERILRERRAYRIAHELAKEAFSKIRTVIGYGTQRIERDLYKRQLDWGRNYVLSSIIKKSFSVALLYIVNFGLWAIVFWYGMDLVLTNVTETCTDKSIWGMYDAGDMFIVILSMIFGVSNIYIVAVVLMSVNVARICAREVTKVMNAPNGIDNMSEEGRSLEELEGKVEFSNVRFTYPGKKNGLALNGLSFVVQPNTLVAFVGTSTSGKSTALKLICKEYLADSGFIEIDGHDIRSLNTQFLRSHIGYIPQEQTLFDMSIEDNIRMGKLDANFFEIQEACITAGAHDFIISFKEGYQTKVGHRGSRLTPGQKQLIAIARALIREYKIIKLCLRDPKILLLDEPTYTLDSSSVAEFMQSLQKISRNRTVILIAQRLSTVVHANKIYVLRNGRVVESGDHHKLIRNRGGPYTQLCMVNRASNSYHPGSKIEGFDTSQMTIISGVKNFNPKPLLPSLYNNMLFVDPVVCRVTEAVLTNDKDTERGFRSRLEWTLKDAEDKPTTSDLRKTEDEEVLKDLRQASSTYNFENSQSNEELVTLKDTKMMNTETEEYHRISILSPSKRTWVRVLSMGSGHSGLIFIGCLSTIFLSFGVPFFGFLVALTIDVLSNTEAYPKSWKWATVFSETMGYQNMIALSIAAVGLYCGIFGFLQDICLQLSAYNSVQTIKRLLYGCILKQDMKFFENPKNTPIALASVLFQDTDAIRHVSWGIYAILLQFFCTFMVCFIICSVHAINLAGYTLLYMGLAVAVNFVDGWLAKIQNGRTMYALQQMSRLILQVFQSKHVITVCQMEPHFLKEFTTVQRKALSSNKSTSCVRVFTYGLAQSAMFWGFGVFLYIGEAYISSGSQKFIHLMINGFVVLFGLMTFGTNLSCLTGFKHINKGGKRMLDIIDKKPPGAQDDSLVFTEHDFKQEIHFVNTHFYKPQAADAPLFKGIHLVIPPNEVTAIVGYPESGKRGFLELLCRYYDATSGLVTIGGKDIFYYNAESLREHLSVILREPELFSRTVAQNIALGAPFRNSTMDDVIQAAKEANCHNLIVSLPNGYETRIGGEHDYLSTAQKQKICIARALLKNPQILVCDELTHHLDKDGEKSVLDSLNRIKKNRTMILIGHRLLPIRNSDWIIVMENGYLEEQGTHKDLMKRNGIYAYMWRSQNPLQDESFVKGTMSFVGGRPSTSKQSTHSVKRPGLIQQSQGTSTPSLPSPGNASTQNEEEDDEEEPKGARFCGGFFSFLGLGIVDPRDENIDDDEVGDR